MSTASEAREFILSTLPQEGERDELVENATRNLLVQKPLLVIQLQAELLRKWVLDIVRTQQVPQQSVFADPDRKTRTQFEKRLESAERGERPFFQVRYLVDSRSLPVGQMTADNLWSAARSFRDQASNMEMEATFLERLAKTVEQKGPNATVADVMDEVTYTKLYKSIVNPTRESA